jgi:cytochrome bd-type quinol oxidase subunit 1
MNTGTIVELSFVAWILWTSRASFAKPALKASLFLERLFTGTTNVLAHHAAKQDAEEEEEEEAS